MTSTRQLRSLRYSAVPAASQCPLSSTTSTLPLSSTVAGKDLIGRHDKMLYRDPGMAGSTCLPSARACVAPSLRRLGRFGSDPVAMTITSAAEFSKQCRCR